MPTPRSESWRRSVDGARVRVVVATVVSERYTATGGGSRHLGNRVGGTRGRPVAAVVLERCKETSQKLIRLPVSPDENWMQKTCVVDQRGGCHTGPNALAGVQAGVSIKVTLLIYTTIPSAVVDWVRPCRSTLHPQSHSSEALSPMSLFCDSTYLVERHAPG